MKHKLTEQQIEEIIEWCYKNNTIKTKYPHLKIAITDGGWVNVLELKKWMEETDSGVNMLELKRFMEGKKNKNEDY